MPYLKNMTVIKAIATFTFIFLTCPRYSYSADLFHSQYTLGDTTDKINFKDLKTGVSLNKRDLYWPYLNESAKSSSLDFDFHHRYQKGPTFKFKYSQAALQYSKIIKERHHILLKGGLYHYDEEGPRESDTRLSAEAKLQSKLPHAINTSLTLARGLMVNEIFLTGQGLRNLEATKVDLRVSKQFWENKLTVKIDYNTHFLKEDNKRTYFDGEIMYALMTYPHWIRVGFGHHTLDYTQSSSSYWSPLDFYAFGPRVDLSFVLKEVWQLYLGGNYSWFEENQTFKGDGYYMRTGLKYGLREDLNFDLAYERNESIQNNNSWVGESLSLSAFYFF